MIRAFWLFVPVLGCSDPEAAADTTGLGPESSACFDAPPGEATAARALQIGVVGPSGFVPLADGDAMALILGYQGGYMVTPSLRVEAIDGESAGVCCRLELVNTVAGAPDIAPGLRGNLLLERQGGYLQSGYLNNLLSFEREPLLGKALELDVHLVAGGFVADAALSVTLVE
jgi:hypothetical protein